MPDKEMMDLLRQSKELIERLNKELKVSNEENMALQTKIETITPTAEFGALVIADDRFYTMKQTADELKEALSVEKGVSIGRNKLFLILRELGILSNYESNWNQPYREYIDRGYFHVKLKETNVGVMQVTMVTGKGLKYIQEKVSEYVDDVEL
jgi:phage antirepressor YoqD-like protein